MKPPIGQMQYSQPLSQRQAQPATAKPAAPHKRADAIYRANPGFVSIGRGLALDVINSRDYSKLSRYVADANSEDPGTAAAGISVLLGFAHTALTAIEQGQAQRGYTLTNGMPCTRQELDYAFFTGRGRFISHFEAIAGTLRRVLDKCPTMTMRLEEQAQPAPLEVKIVSQPDRATTTQIQRDSLGNIVNSTQIETNA